MAAQAVNPTLLLGMVAAAVEPAQQEIITIHLPATGMAEMELPRLFLDRL
jgi:hypothetical protein